MCKPVDAPLLPEKTADINVPDYMLPMVASPDRLLGALKGQCLIILGDSSMTETAHDVAIILAGWDYLKWINFVNAHTPPWRGTFKIPERGLEAVFYHGHRSFQVTSTEHDVAWLFLELTFFHFCFVWGADFGSRLNSNA